MPAQPNRATRRRAGRAAARQDDERALSPEAFEREPEQEIDVEQALKFGRRLAIIGGPGSGKTTVLNHIAWALASSLVYGTDEARTRLGLSDTLPVPILLPLASYAAYRRDLKMQPGIPASEYTLGTYIAKYLTRRGALYALPEDFFTALMDTGRDVMLLLDGLDEVADEDEREQVSQAVEGVVGGKDKLRAVVTCRTAAYATGRTALATFRVLTVQPLDPFDMERHIAPMVRNAYACIYTGDQTTATHRADDLILGIQTLEQQRLQRLGEKAEPLTISPLMVRMLLIVHYDNRRLPPDRAELYDRAVDALIKSEHVPDVEVAQLLRPMDPELHLAMVQSLPPYQISRYPITYAQFQAFIDAPDGFADPRWWKGLAADEDHRGAPGEQQFRYANHPRERVSWYDAVAFCRWLSEKLGQTVSLPTEEQWEKAARGRVDRHAVAGGRRVAQP